MVTARPAKTSYRVSPRFCACGTRSDNFSPKLCISSHCSGWWEASGQGHVLQSPCLRRSSVSPSATLVPVLPPLAESCSGRGAGGECGGANHLSRLNPILPLVFSAATRSDMWPPFTVPLSFLTKLGPWVHSLPRKQDSFCSQMAFNQSVWVCVRSRAWRCRCLPWRARGAEGGCPRRC